MPYRVVGISANVQGIVSILSTGEGIDSEALKADLCELGMQGVLEELLDGTIYIHAGFARPGQGEDVAKAGWLDIWHKGAETGVEKQQLA